MNMFKIKTEEMLVIIPYNVIKYIAYDVQRNELEISFINAEENNNLTLDIEYEYIAEAIDKFESWNNA